jgi:hypothetical protein
MNKTLALIVFAAACIPGAEFARPAATAKPSGKEAEKPLMADAEHYKSAASESRQILQESMGDPPRRPRRRSGRRTRTTRPRRTRSPHATDLVKKFTESFGGAKGLSDDDIGEAVNGWSSCSKKWATCG